MSHNDAVVKRIKDAAWQTAVGTMRLMPRSLRIAAGRALIASLSGKKHDWSLRDLFVMEDSLHWYIDKAAINYERGIHPKHRLMRYSGFFTDRINAEERVLDLGCGQGVVAYGMAVKGAYVTGVDLSRDNISKARDRFPHKHLEFVVADARTYAPANRQDVIVMSNFLEHIDERTALLKYLWEKHRPRAVLLRVPMADRHWSVPLRAEVGCSTMIDPTHRVEYTVPTFIAEMSVADLSVRYLQVNWGEIWAEVGRAGD